MLDLLFGAEEEFQYTPPANSTSSSISAEGARSNAGPPERVQITATELAAPRELDGEGDTDRRGDASSVAELGIAGRTFDQVARAAGVSRGLLHYYFGSKERLLVEAVRRECDVRDQQLDARSPARAAPSRCSTR